jgi:transposase-like protein
MAVTPVSITCPFCDSSDTELMSLFGQQLLTVQYYCNSCGTPFERVKDTDILPDARAHASGEHDQR